MFGPNVAESLGAILCGAVQLELFLAQQQAPDSPAQAMAAAQERVSHTYILSAPDWLYHAAAAAAAALGTVVILILPITQSSTFPGRTAHCQMSIFSTLSTCRQFCIVRNCPWGRTVRTAGRRACSAHILLSACCCVLTIVCLQSLSLCDQLPYAFNVTLDCNKIFIGDLPDIAFTIGGKAFNVPVRDYAYQVSECAVLTTGC